MARSLNWFLFASLSLVLLNARSQYVIEGHVEDAFSKRPLEDVHIVAGEPGIGTYSSAEGSFILEDLPAGQYTLRLSRIGYETRDFTLDPSIQSGHLKVTLRPVTFEIDPVTITATLNRRTISSLPGRGAVISREQAEALPAFNTDDLLLGIANVYVNRPWGIFSKGASVSMRGLPGSARTLILLDGAPMNKIAGGTVNWNFLEPADIERIEVIKGPSSALYGNNAMGGVISLETRKPKKTLDGHLRAFGGSMGTYGGSVMAGGRKEADKGFYWNTKAFMRRGDGYIIQPEENRDTTDVATRLEEYNAGFKAGYQFDSTKLAELDYRYYHGTFGTGTRVYEEDGAWDRYRSHLLQGRYEAVAGKYTLTARAFYQHEIFDRQSESINRTGKYKLSDSESLKHDQGIWVNASRVFFNDHLFTAGLDIKIGDMIGEEIYRTSTDELNYGGKLAFAGIFVQDEFRVMRKLSVIAGMRFDLASFYKGYQEVFNPTSNTGFLTDTAADFAGDSWMRWSPKLALKYELNEKLGWYASFSTGFMPPKIDDLVRSGKISKGFKLANPELSPEFIYNYEAGMDWRLFERLSLEPSVYYSRGYDFQYFVATGDSVETGGADLKPVLQRQNVSEVEILGAEISLRWEIISNLVLHANYVINRSRILSFDDPMGYGKDLVGKSLIEMPLSQAYAAVSWRNKVIDVHVDWRYTDKEWYDDENTQYIEPYHVFGLKLGKSFLKKYRASLSVENIFDEITLDRKGMLNPGRFILAEIIYNI